MTYQTEIIKVGEASPSYVVIYEAAWPHILRPISDRLLKMDRTCNSSMHIVKEQAQQLSHHPTPTFLAGCCPDLVIFYCVVDHRKKNKGGHDHTVWQFRSEIQKNARLCAYICQKLSKFKMLLCIMGMCAVTLFRNGRAPCISDCRNRTMPGQPTRM